MKCSFIKFSILVIGFIITISCKNEPAIKNKSITDISEEQKFLTYLQDSSCDNELFSTLDLKVCLGEKVEKSDSIIDSYYNFIIEKIDKKYAAELKSPNDTIGIKVTTLKDLSNLKNSVIESKKSFSNLQKSIGDIIDYESGYHSGQIIMANRTILKLNISHILFLIDLKEEI